MFEKVLITGASSGIGEATALAFAEKGSELFLVARRRQRLEQVARCCEERGSPRTAFLPCDLSVPGHGQLLIRECLQRLGGLEVLVCNAGYGIFGPVADTAPQSMARIWQVNYQSAYESIHEALPHLLRQGRGHIVLTSSILGKKAISYAGAYCATKFAQVGLGEALWGELRGSGVGVSVICPGYTDSEFHDSAELSQGTRQLSRRIQGQSPEVVAAAVVNAVSRKRREVHLTAAAKLLLTVDRFSPGAATRIMAFLGRRERGQPDKSA